MSTDSALRATYDEPVQSVPSSSDRVRDWLLAATTVLGPLLIAIALIVEVDDGADDQKGTELLATIAEGGIGRFYAGNLIGAIGLALMGAGGLTVMRLVRARGGALATVGGVLSMIAATAAATGLFMYGAVGAVMAGDGLDREAMGALQDELNDAAQLAPAYAIGFMGLAISLLLLAGALLRSRAVAWWVPAAIVVSLVLFTIVDGGALGAAVMLPMIAGFVVLAQRLLRSSGHIR